jgi:hypothetical protein
MHGTSLPTDKTRQEVVLWRLAADEQLNRDIVQEPVLSGGLVDVLYGLAMLLEGRSTHA